MGKELAAPMLRLIARLFVAHRTRNRSTHWRRFQVRNCFPDETIADSAATGEVAWSAATACKPPTTLAVCPGETAAISGLGGLPAGPVAPGSPRPRRHPRSRQDHSPAVVALRRIEAESRPGGRRPDVFVSPAPGA